MNDYFPDLIDSSMLATFKSCPQKFYKEYVLNWKAKEVSVHLHAGAAFARGLEVTRRAFYADGASTEAAIAKGLQALVNAYGDFTCPPESAKSLERVAGAFVYYWENYALSDVDAFPVLLPGNKRAIEYSFAHPLPILHPLTGQPLIYCGRMDAIINYGGSTLICDEKTTTSLGPTWSRQWDLRSQFLGYCWGCREAGVRVEGAIVRGVAILKTKFDTQQAIILHPEWQLSRWYTETLSWVQKIIECYTSKEWIHNYDHACSEYGGCSFRQACLSIDEGPWLDTYFEQLIWNPLLRTETKL